VELRRNRTEKIFRRERIRRFQMEFRLENGWNGGGWLLDPRMPGLFMDFNATTTPIVPSVDVIEDKDAYHFYFEMPGLKNDSIDARVENGRLIVAAERKRPEWPEETEVHVAERRHGTIRRAFELPKDARHDKVDASYKDGVLELTVEKKAESKPAKIQIN
jgi:HSP20 family protein